MSMNRFNKNRGPAYFAGQALGVILMLCLAALLVGAVVWVWGMIL